MNARIVDYFADRWLTQPPQYRTDLHRCQPQDAISDQPRRRRWRALPYESGGLSGTMLLAGPETVAPVISYPLGLHGWHAISVGVMPIDKESRELELELKLTGDQAPTLLTLPSGEGRPGGARHGLVELFWKIAELDGQNLEIGQIAARVAEGDGPGSFACEPVRLAYLKLVPLTEVEAAAVQVDRARTDTRRLFAHQDAHGPHYLWRLTRPDQIRRELEPYRDTDFARMYWEAGEGDFTYYFSEIGRATTFDTSDDFQRRGDRFHAESWRVFRDRGVDPFEVALEHAHAVGLEFHACYRVAGFHYPPPSHIHDVADTFYRTHPQWRGVDRAGTVTPRMAYTYPAVRQYVISLLREMAERPVDGVCLLYNRRPPLVEYESPLVEGFMSDHGVDPRQLDPHDPQWLAYRARALTRFHRELRTAMDELARERRRARRIQISAVVLSDHAENLYHGLDLQAWVREGLVDTLIPYSSAPNLDSNVAAWTDPRAAKYFVDLVKDTPVVLAPNVMPRHLTPEGFRRRAAGLFGAGVDHLFFWDCAGGAGRANYRDMWSALRRLGHRDEIAAWQAAGEPGLSLTPGAIDRLADWDFSYATPG